MASRACQSLCCAAQRTAGALHHAAQLAAAPPPPPLRTAVAAARPRRSVAVAAADNSDAEVAVFRFTLGSDAADALVPRVVGGVGAALLLLNHLLGDQPSDAQASWHCASLVFPAPLLSLPLLCSGLMLRVCTLCLLLCSNSPLRAMVQTATQVASAFCAPSALLAPLQLRAEALGAVLAAVAFATPTIEQRLKELQPGRGRQAAAASVAGAASVFALQPGLPDSLKQVGRGWAEVWCRIACKAMPLPTAIHSPHASLHSSSAHRCCMHLPPTVAPSHKPPSLPPTQELAWASYALLLNTNICGLAVYWDGRAVLARGQLGAAALGGAAAGGSKSDPSAVLDALSVAEPAAASRGWRQGPLYCPDKAAIAKAGAGGWPCVPAGAESLLVQPLLPFSRASGSSSGSGSSAGGATPQGFMLLLSERPRALSGKERAWAAAVAAKLHDALQQG